MSSATGWFFFFWFTRDLGFLPFGFRNGGCIITLADLGVTLLIHHRLEAVDIKTLLSKEIWAGATIHNLYPLCFASPCWFWVPWHFVTGSYVSRADCSTRLRPIILEYRICGKDSSKKGEMNATYGTLAISILDHARYFRGGIPNGLDR